MEVFNFFPTCVWITTITDLDNKKLNYQVTKFSKNNDSVAISNVGGYQGHEFENDKLNKIIIKNTPLLENKPLEKYTLHTWVNINKKGNYNKRHNHLNTNIFLSGVYYVSVPENSGNIRFYDPRGSWMQSMVDHNYFFDGHEYNYLTPAPGMLLYFPSWLEHDVEENLSNEDRVSIAFNIYTN